MTSLCWLRDFAQNVIQSQEHPVVDSVEILMHQLIAILRSSSIDESSLIDLVGMEMIHSLPDLLDKKDAILAEWSSALATGAKMIRDPNAPSPSVDMGQTLSQIRLVRQSEVSRTKQLKKLAEKQKKGPVSATNWISGYDDELALLSQLGWSDGGRRTPPPRAGDQSSSSTAFGGPRVVLPEGTSRHLFEGYEEYRIPATGGRYSTSDTTGLVAVSSLPKWAQPVFTDSAYLNRIQSKVFPVAFGQSDNFLMCAPTGSGKTNVAMLAICRLIQEWKSTPAASRSPIPDFKVVYLAPMKALVSEIVDKFTSKLTARLGVSVREFTGDISIPRKELEAVNVIVTVPEKWDILLRNLGKVSAATVPGETAHSLLAQLRLMIIDEVHLLNDERGAVIESIVARTMRFAETACSPIRCVALSATFPNYDDIASFLGVQKQNVFFFDGSYRPVPLEQTIVGVGSQTTPGQRNVVEAINKVTAEKVYNILKEGEQVMVFVHARNDTTRTADTLIEMISAKIAFDRNGADILRPAVDTAHQAQLLASVGKHGSGSSRVRSVMKSLIESGITVHHAGMLRPERTLAENLFKEGVARVLVCTATLAWGVNLPSRYVIIKGTSIWDSGSGGFKDIDLLDILQIFGRAGRPQFDTIGRATLITSRDKLDHFLRLMTSQIPIESRFSSHLADALNAEISMGNISTVHEAVSWLRYTYMYVRFFKAPQKYGIAVSDLSSDPMLEKFRTDLINAAAETLNTAHLIRISRSAGGSFNSTDLGRVAAHFYVRWDTAEMFANKLRPDMTDADIVELVGNAHEFSQLKCREEEMEELESVSVDKTICPITKLRGGGLTSIPVKVGVLLQVYVSRNYQFQSSSLSSDMNYVCQNINRLFRCLFEVSLTRTVGVSGLSQRLLEWCKIVERRLWWPEDGDNHFLRHYTSPPNWFNMAQSSNPQYGGGPKCLKEWIVTKLEERKLPIERIWDAGLSRGEMHAVVGNAPDAIKSLQIFINRIPKIEITHRVIPITPELVTVELSLHLTNQEWADSWSGLSEPFHVFLDDPDSEDIYYHTQLNVHKKERFEAIVVSATIPLTDPKPNQLTVSVVSDRYVGLEFFETITVPKSIKLGAMDGSTKPTTLLDLHPLPVAAALDNKAKYISLFKFSHFNPIQTQVFHQLYHEDVNVLVGAPTGSGKTALAELAMLRVFNQPRPGKVIYIAPMKALSKERISDWQLRIGKQLGQRVEELTGDFTPDADALRKADVLVTTPEKWDGVSRNWRNRDYVKSVALVIIDEIHLLGQERGAILEIIVSRMRLIASETASNIRFIGLSTALANPSEIASWLNVNPFTGLFNFKPSVRPVPMTVHVQGFPEKHYCPRMATMNKPALQAIKTYSPEKPVIVFVSSRRQTRLTAFDLITYASQDTSHYASLIGGPGQSPWLRLDQPIDLILARVENDALKHTLSFGVGIHHAGLSNADRALVETLFQSGQIQILVATSTVGVGVNLPAHLVVIKGTEFFDPKTKKYKDMPTTDVLQMMGRAGRPQFDTSAVAVVMVHEPKKNFYRKFLYSPFPLESSLHAQLCDHLNAEIASGSVQCLSDAMEFLSWTYLFRRVSVNPDFYGVLPTTGTNADIIAFLEDLVMKCVAKLEAAGCVHVIKPVSVTAGIETRFEPNRLGQIASMYYLKHESARHMSASISRDAVGGKSVLALAKILADCAEFDEFPMRHKDDVYSGELAETVPFKVDEKLMKMDDPHTKGFLLIIAHMFGLPMPIQDFFTDLRSLLDQSVRILQAMLEICLLQKEESGTLRTVLNLLLLNQCMSAGTHPWCNLTKFMLGRPVKGFDGPFVDLLEKVHNERIDGIDGKQVSFLKKLPLARLAVLGADEGGKVTVNVSHANSADEFFVTPLSMTEAQNSGGKRRRVAWWIVVGSEQTGEVTMAKRITVTKDRPKKIEIPTTGKPQTLFLLSDCYFGIDQVIDL